MKRMQATSRAQTIFSPLFLYSFPLILFLLAFVFYYPSAHYDFQFDDSANITQFFNIRHSDFRDIFFSSTRWISTWLNTVHYSIGKFDPYSYRLFNISMHALTSVLLFFLLYYALSGLKKKSFFTAHAFVIASLSAGIFLLHPVQTQTISYVIQGQLEGLAGFFVISMTLCFLMLTRARSDLIRSALGLLLTVLAFLACGTKEIVIVAPLLLLMFDWFFVAQGNSNAIKNRWYVHGFLFLLIGGIYVYHLKPAFFGNVLGLRIEAHNNMGNVLTENPAEKILPLHFFISQFKVMVHYITIFIWPFTISVEYDWKLVKGFFAPDCIIPFSLLLILAGYTIYRLRKNSIDLFAFAVMWFFVTILPRSSIIPSSELLADYKTYVGSLGPIFLLASAFLYICLYCTKSVASTLSAARHLYIQLACILLCLLFFGTLTYERNKVWKSTEAFWSNILHNAPRKARAYTGYGAALVAKGNSKEAISYYQKAIALESKYSDPSIMFDIFVWNNLAVAYSSVGEIDKAIETLKCAVLIRPNYPEVYNNLATFLMMKKDFAQAEQALNCAIELRPHYGGAWLNKGKIYAEQDKIQEAFECVKHACTKADADNEAGFGAYARISIELKKYDDAIYAFKKLIELNPCVQYMVWLAAAYIENNNISDAIGMYQKILHKNPHEFIALHHIGEAYIRLHEWEKALSYFIRAYGVNQSASHSSLQIAHCLMELKRYAEAQKHLEMFIAQEKVHESHKKIARIGLIESERMMQQFCT